MMIMERGSSSFRKRLWVFLVVVVGMFFLVLAPTSVSGGVKECYICFTEKECLERPKIATCKKQLPNEGDDFFCATGYIRRDTDTIKEKICVPANKLKDQSDHCETKAENKVCICSTDLCNPPPGPEEGKSGKGKGKGSGSLLMPMSWTNVLWMGLAVVFKST